MGKITAAITGVGEYLPDYILTNEELSRMVDTTDEWIMSHVGIKTRHILLKPRVSLDDEMKAVHSLDSVANLIRTGKMTFEQAVVYYSQDKNTALNAGLMLNERSGTSKKEVVAIVKVKSKVDTHKANLTDDYQMLKSYYESKRGDDFIKNWITKKQKETYINIDPAWSNCEFRYPGWIK